MKTACRPSVHTSQEKPRTPEKARSAISYERSSSFVPGDLPLPTLRPKRRADAVIFEYDVDSTGGINRHSSFVHHGRMYVST
jgi:hypothetical protein